MPWSPQRHNSAKVKQRRDTQQRVYNRTKRTGQEFYKTTAWKKLRTAYAKANPICEDCKALDRATALDVVDHIDEIKDGGEPLAWDNLRSLCHLHHNQKTARFRNEKGKQSTATR